jgi:uncharacterized protein involved in exopolysaccharide biosynthesis
VAIETQKSVAGFALAPEGKQLEGLSMQTPEYVPQLSLRSFAEACFRRPRLLISVTGLLILLTVLAVAFLPKRYEATMQLEVLNTRQYSVISSSSESGEPAQSVGGITDSDVNSQAELLRSRDVLNQALDQLGKPTLPAASRDRAIQILKGALDVAPVRESNILNVSYEDSSPEKARETLQAVASSFVARELALLRPTQSQQLFARLVDEKQRELKTANDEFAKFKVESGIASLKDDESALLRQLESSSSQAASLNAELALEQRRAERTGEELGHHPERITTQDRSTPNQAAIESLTALLVQLQNKRTSLLNGYQPTERIVQDIEAQIHNVETQLSQLRSANATETTTDVNPLKLELTAQLARAQIASSALAAQRRSVEAQKHAYLLQLNGLEERAAQFETLQKQVSEAQRNMDSAIQKRDQAAVDDALDRDRILNVAFAAKPSASSIPVRPRPLFYLLLGLFSGVFFGVAACVVCELTANTIYAPAELDALTGVTTLAAIPLQKLGDAEILGLNEKAGVPASALSKMPDGGHSPAPLQAFVARSRTNAFD